MKNIKTIALLGAIMTTIYAQPVHAKKDTLANYIKKHAKDKPKSVSKSSYGVVKTAKSRLGRKYRYGKYDCSKFVQDVMHKSKGKRLPRTTRQQIKIGKHISKKSARKGDLVFFGDNSHRVGHVGIIIDPKKKLMIHNSSAKGRVVISSYNTKYYNKKYRGIRRI